MDILRTKVFILVKLIDCSKAICKVTDNPGPLSTIFQKSFQQTPCVSVPYLVLFGQTFDNVITFLLIPLCYQESKQEMNALQQAKVNR